MSEPEPLEPDGRGASDESPEASQMRSRVHAALLAHGATSEEIARAEEDDVLDLLVADRLLDPKGARYTEKEVSERTHMDVDLARRFWRALGFADVSEDERVFTDLDVEAINIVSAMMLLGGGDIEIALQLTRVVGSSMARIAEAEVAALGGLARMGPETSNLQAADRFVTTHGVTLPSVGHLLEYVWRRHVQAATRRAMSLRARAGEGALPELCVGFADMVGFTALSQQLGEEDLAAVVARFEEVAHETVTSNGGRIVKMIGDEAMFVTERSTDAAQIALALSEAYAGDDVLSDVRVGLSIGPVLSKDGDYYGAVVNFASRIVNMADPGTILVSDEFEAAVSDATHPSAPREEDDQSKRVGDFAFRLLRPRYTRDFGRVHLWALTRAGVEPGVYERRVGRRLERISDVLHDLEELRERGERLLLAGRRPASFSAAAADRAAQWQRRRSKASQAGGRDGEGTELEGPVEGT